MPAGRPKKPIDYESVEKLASMMCTQEEIANYLDLSTKTLQRDKEFCRIYKKGLDKGKMSLRRQQYQAAQNGNVSMQIWLGKNYLGQSDKSVDEIEKIKADKEFTKERTKALKGIDKDTSMMNELIKTINGDS